ncbi:hypothetical protein SAMD00024442_6_13 [Candidatus Symbiothrix dinenymphae]|nr:hypothetical protein SAMD00024442_6_13 [Candidatus Symbiothrix dinenymphae]
MYIPEDIKNKILSVSEDKLKEVVEDFAPLHKSGVSWVCDCPICNAERMLTVTPGKNIFKCFRCNDFSGKGAVAYLMKGHNKTFPEALEYLAKKFDIFIDEPKPVPKPKSTKKAKGKAGADANSFCARMLAESGLTAADVTACVYRTDDNSAHFESRTFKPGTLDQYNNIVPGDDVIIEYYDLDGNPVTYEQKDSRGKLTGRQKEYFRVRWQYPPEHLDKEGKPQKYKSPYGSFANIYIPEKIRATYKAKEKLPRLYIQEGEKKAEKATKHGLPSIAISGISALGHGGRLPEDLIRIIQTCQVEEVIFLLDADWDDLSATLRVTDQVERRPRNFFFAVKNYKEYMRTLKNRDLYVEIYFGYVLKNEKNDKGIDDLLANLLAGNEAELSADIEHLINEKDLKGKYIQLHKITTWTDHKLEEIWGLNNPRVFAERHKSILKDMPEFVIGRHKWHINDAGELESSQPVESDEQFWIEREKHDKQGNPFTVYDFNYNRSLRFLQNRGFGRHRRLDGTFEYIHLTPPSVRTVETWEVRDFLFEFTKANCKEDVLEMILRGGTQYLGPDKISHMEFIDPNFKPAERDRQIFYFANNCWEISADKISEMDYANVTHHIWKEQRKKLPAQLTVPLLHVTKTDNRFAYKLTALGTQCHFLQFLINTSNFTWRKEELQKTQPDFIIPEDELYENTEHLIAKLCAIGYMLMECKDRSNSKAVVAMDGRQSEVGASNGRSGKSIIGELFKHVMSTVYINGKKSDLGTDNFLWDELVEKTKAVFIDDVRPGFDFESLFANITGDWAVNYKGGRRSTFPFATSPKIYITTNHALNGEGSSFRDRQWLIAFSDYYNDQRKPINDFGVMFFDEWDFEQWNLTWNLLAACVQLYLKFGVVESPGERLAQRQLRQFMGEEFISWAEEYFSAEEKLNTRIARKDMFDTFLAYAPDQRKWCKATTFKKRIIKYCDWKNLKFNPHRYDPLTGLPMYHDKEGKPDIDDKSGGVEYFTIGDANFRSSGADGGGEVDAVNVDLFKKETKGCPF